MSNYKYLSDGRKVVVIGQLNNIESIVQEVFVTKDGDEIPSGEKFTTKNLHDEPMISWKDKKEKQIEDRIKQLEQKYTRKEIEFSDLDIRHSARKSINRQVALLADNLNENDLQTLIDFMSGNCEYLVVGGYGSPSIETFEEKITSTEGYRDNKRFDAIKLASLYGSSNGELSYRIHEYKDGSGSWVKVHPCRSLDDAIIKCREIIVDMIENDRFLDQDKFKKLSDLGLTLPKKYKDKMYDKWLSSYKESLRKAKESFENTLSRITKPKKP